MGNVVMWQWKGQQHHLIAGSPGKQLEGADKWEFLTTSGLAGPIVQVQVGLCT